MPVVVWRRHSPPPPAPASPAWSAYPAAGRGAGTPPGPRSRRDRRRRVCHAGGRDIGVGPAAGTARPAPAGEPPTPLAALPPELRRELPPLDIGGSVWSESPASRFVIINGQLVHEGQTAAPGVVVERIAQRSAVLRWRERRIELPL
ncbi:MAG: general secretion pathway protein GspB [Rubrivivax sp.]|nr:general secretion pathway protein GspB [Rubrivivax sp.]